MTKILKIDEIVTGMELMMRAQTAAAVAQAQQQALDLYIDHLRRIHEAPADGWPLASWTGGFVEKTEASDGTGNNQ